METLRGKLDMLNHDKCIGRLRNGKQFHFEKCWRDPLRKLWGKNVIIMTDPTGMLIYLSFAIRKVEQ